MNVLEVKAALAAAVFGCAYGGERASGVPAAAAALPTTCGSRKSESPSGNTGDKLTIEKIEKHYDWGNFTFPVGRRDEVQVVIEGYLGAAKRRDRGANTYGQSVGWESGAILAWTDGRAEAWLSLNGDSCDLVPVSAKVALLRALQALGAKCTRADYAIDVSRDLVSMEMVHAAARAGHVVGFRRYFPKRPVRDMATGELDQDEADFGRRGRDGSGRYVRVYDKGLESDGEIDAIRFEVETSGQVADLWFRIICDVDDDREFCKVLGKIVVGSITFADKTGSHGHVDRFKTLEFWQRIIDLVGAASVQVSRVTPTLERSVQFVKRLVPTIFARLSRVVTEQGMQGDELVLGLVRDLLQVGRVRLAFRGDPPPLDGLIDLHRILDVRGGLCAT
jgi:hypothetical protein